MPEGREKVKLAVEWNPKTLVTKYHPIKELKDIPEGIFDSLNELATGRRGLAG